MQVGEPDRAPCDDQEAFKRAVHHQAQAFISLYSVMTSTVSQC